VCDCFCVGLARTIHIRCIYGILGRNITKCTVIYGVYIRFWPTLLMCGACVSVHMCKVGENHIYIPGMGHTDF